MMALVRHLALWFAILAVSYGRPPNKPRPAENQVDKSHETAGRDGTEGGNGTAQWDLGIEYNRYLQEVVQVLESDPDFRKKLEDSDVEKIREIICNIINTIPGFVTAIKFFFLCL